MYVEFKDIFEENPPPRKKKKTILQYFKYYWEMLWKCGIYQMSRLYSFPQSI